MKKHDTELKRAQAGRIDEALRLRGKTRSDLARFLGVSLAGVSKMLAIERKYPLVHSQEIATFLQVSERWLRDGDKAAVHYLFQVDHAGECYPIGRWEPPLKLEQQHRSVLDQQMIYILEPYEPSHIFEHHFYLFWHAEQAQLVCLSADHHAFPLNRHRKNGSLSDLRPLGLVISMIRTDLLETTGLDLGHTLNPNDSVS